LGVNHKPYHSVTECRFEHELDHENDALQVLGRQAIGTLKATVKLSSWDGRLTACQCHIDSAILSQSARKSTDDPENTKAEQP